MYKAETQSGESVAFLQSSERLLSIQVKERKDPNHQKNRHMTLASLLPFLVFPPSHTCAYVRTYKHYTPSASAITQTHPPLDPFRTTPPSTAAAWGHRPASRRTGPARGAGAGSAPVLCRTPPMPRGPGRGWGWGWFPRRRPKTGRASPPVSARAGQVPVCVWEWGLVYVGVIAGGGSSRVDVWTNTHA